MTRNSRRARVVLSSWASLLFGCVAFVTHPYGPSTAIPSPGLTVKPSIALFFDRTGQLNGRPLTGRSENTARLRSRIVQRYQDSGLFQVVDPAASSSADYWVEVHAWADIESPFALHIVGTLTACLIPIVMHESVTLTTRIIDRSGGDRGAFTASGKATLVCSPFMVPFLVSNEQWRQVFRLSDDLTDQAILQAMQAGAFTRP